MIKKTRIHKEKTQQLLLMLINYAWNQYKNTKNRQLKIINYIKIINK